MTRKKRPYSDADMAEVSDNPEWTEADLRRSISGKDFLDPEVLRDLERQGDLRRKARSAKAGRGESGPSR
ncbi:MAG: hypothetical protein KIS96_12865 [Bauldia sp.]|nr:hypothetical protein [Bauldia sp.]